MVGMLIAEVQAQGPDGVIKLREGELVSLIGSSFTDQARGIKVFSVTYRVIHIPPGSVEWLKSNRPQLSEVLNLVKGI